MVIIIIKKKNNPETITYSMLILIFVFTQAKFLYAFPKKSVLNHHYLSLGSTPHSFEMCETIISAVLSTTNLYLVRRSILSSQVYKPSMKCNEEVEKIKSRSCKLQVAIYHHYECTLI